MNQYKIKITSKALTDMKTIYEYITENFQAPDTAMNQYNRIALGIESLKDFPKRCKLFDSKQERDLGFRQLFVDNYSIIYIVETNKVTILRVLYSSSDINNRLRDSQS